ncbi:MAG: lipopolysaccharide biosynthesis protein [Bacteroidales bacterium]
MSESLKTKTIKGVSWSFVDNIAGSGIMFLVGLILARILTPKEFGLIGIISIFIAVFNSIVDSGFSNALIRKHNATHIDYNTAFIFNLVLSIFLFIGLFFFAPFVGSFFEEPQLVPLTRAMSVIVLINAFALVQRTLLVKRVDFKTQTKISIIASISSGVIGIGMALSGFGVWSLVAQQISRQLLNTVFLWIFNKWLPKLEFSIKSFKELFGFGWKLLVSGLIDTIWNQLYQVIIGKFYSTSDLGQFTRARGFSDIFSSNLTGVVQRVSYPVLSSIQDDNERLKQAYKKIIKSTMFMAFVLMLGLAAVAKPMVLILIGEKWLPSVEFLQIICFSAMLYPLHAINLNMLQVKGRSDLFLILEIVKKTIAVGPILLGIFVNINAMLWGSVIIGFICYYLNSYYSGRDLNYGIMEQIKDILPSFLIAFFMAAIVWAISFINITPFLLLPIQLILGFIIIFAIGEKTKMNEYIELKEIIVSTINKILKWKINK